jgi:drug/metabolite transporter (DMT)-like permease
MILKTIITKYLSITLISIVYNMIPMFVIIIAWLTIHEKIDVIEIAMLGLTTIFLSAIVWNGHKKNDEQVDWDEILMYFLLFIQTVGTAAGTVALRTLKKFDETIILWYSYWCAIVISLPIVYIFSDGLAIFNYFNLLDWTIMTVTALAKMLMLWTKIKALQLQSSAKLQILSPVQTVITFVVQITLFHEPFTDFQYWMLALIGVLYFLEGIYIIFF